MFVLVVPAFVACGGGDDDDDDDGGSSQVPGGSSGSNSGSKSDAKLPQVKAGNYGSGKVHIEITGDKDLKLDLDGNGFAQDGYALFTYAGTDATVAIALSNESEDTPGAVTVTHKDVATAAEWGSDCKITFEQSGGTAKGDFSCDTVDGIQPGGTKSYRIKLKGTFSAGP